MLEGYVAVARGLHQDVDDLEVVRRHFEIDRVDLLGHSYVGLTAALYAMKYPGHAGRMVQIVPIQPHAATHPPDRTGADATLSTVLAELHSFARHPDQPIRSRRAGVRSTADRLVRLGRRHESNAC